MYRNKTYDQFLSLAVSFMLGVSILFPHFFGATVILYSGLIIHGVVSKRLYFKVDPIGWILIAFYFTYLTGTLKTEHWDIASKTLEYKLSFFLFPLLFAFKPKQGGFHLPIISSGLVLSVLLATFYGLFNAFMCYFGGGGKTCFLTVIVSPIHHPTYFVVYWITALIAVWFGKFNNWKNYKLSWILPFTLLGIAIHALSLSLAGILFLMLTIFITVIYSVTRKFGRIAGIISLFTLPFIGFLIITRTPQIEGEWNGAKWYAEQYAKDPEGFVRNAKYPMSGSEERLILWTVSAQEFSKNLMGVGTGNTEETIANALIDHGQTEQAEKNLNPHNQFLQTGLEVGMIGLTVLIVILGFGIYQGIRNGNPLLLIVSSALAFNCLFESMLQRQSGVVFFALMMCTLGSSALMQYKKEKSLN
ncbi:MAG: hypothetical protein EP322_01165 [Bacteroidetes bacterium]|nr:MAG: hypothetical protein EP322_01165 [Bacteroidota bacterium]